MSRRLRILLSAYYCSPYRGSESAVGWNIARQLARRHDVTVVTGDLSSELPAQADWQRWREENPEGIEGLTLVHVPPDPKTIRVHDWHSRKGLWFLYYAAYRRWQKLALEAARMLHEDQPFDLVHHLTIIGYREPGELWKLGVPFFWGPINGAVMTPWRFFSQFGKAGIYRHITRNLLNGMQMRLPSRSRRTAAHAAKIWAVTEEDRRMVEDVWGFEAETMIETGSTPDPQAVPRKPIAGEALRLIWCGLVEDRKGIPLLLRAIAGIDGDAAPILHVVGDGPERSRCEALARDLGLGERVVWHGRIDHHLVSGRMADSHLFVHTAIKEGTPHVVLEALASGLPVLCHDACGMGTAVDENCGVKVPLRDPESSIRSFRSSILRLMEDSGELTRLSKGAIARSVELSWERLGDRIADAYEAEILT
ncbi:glycosyltransferase family 4 protein [Haloferula rosea]|uniref:Glycosyltransferase family 4 protein n=1 Tax=Haloferula rosea TaxID=490093 RepID=A0A934R9U7_9BACT|nr:glycosyltransferase family 4 protein [Haloferula rosea]MBK1827819.1 glycosyltransferase family 4 protein [Haloferula rosea]